VPDLLTQEEAIRVLRLDSVGLKKPKEALRYLRRTRQIGYIQVAGKVLIPRDEIVAYVERHRVQPLGRAVSPD
jgi:hypothetical protein